MDELATILVACRRSQVRLLSPGPRPLCFDGRFSVLTDPEQRRRLFAEAGPSDP